MTYDPIDANDDGVVEADVDNESVSTEKSVTDTPVMPRAREQFGNGQLNGGRARPASGKVVFTIDDAHGTVYDNRDVFVDNGVRPTLNKITGSSFTGGDYMTWDEVKEVYDEEGWTILPHGTDEERFDTLTESEIEQRLTQSIKDIRERGIQPGNMFVYAGGVSGGDTGERITSNYFDFARSSGGGRVPLNGNFNHYNLSTVSTETTTQAEIETELDNADSDNDLILMMIHEIQSGDTTKQKIQDIIDYINNQTTLDIVSWPQATRYIPQQPLGVLTVPSTGDTVLRHRTSRNRIRVDDNGLLVEPESGGFPSATMYFRAGRTQLLEGLQLNGQSIYELREISNPTASDLQPREWAWDATNGRWLFRDSGGTAHFFTPDGTL